MKISTKKIVFSLERQFTKIRNIVRQADKHTRPQAAKQTGRQIVGQILGQMAKERITKLNYEEEGK